jgi:hypothetical protein
MINIIKNAPFVVLIFKYFIFKNILNININKLKNININKLKNININI